MDALRIHVREGWSLDGGQVTVQEHPDRIDYVITPPTPTMLDQLIDYLEHQPYDPPKNSRLPLQSLGLAALAIRWGTYFACLCEPAFPLYAPEQYNYPDAEDAPISRLMNAEMRRMNIEVSANLARLGRMSREEPERFHQLLWRAYQFLPMPLKQAAPHRGLQLRLASAHLAGSVHMLAVSDSDTFREAVQALELPLDANVELQRSRQIVEPPGDWDRVIGNYLAAKGWRNTSIEDYHAGIHLSVDAPLLPAQRRFTPADERQLMKELTGSAYEFLLLYPALFDPTFRTDDPQYRYALPYPKSAFAIYNAGALSYYPTHWSLTDISAE